MSEDSQMNVSTSSVDDEDKKVDVVAKDEIVGTRVRVKKWNAVAFWSYGHQQHNMTVRT